MLGRVLCGVSLLAGLLALLGDRYYFQNDHDRMLYLPLIVGLIALSMVGLWYAGVFQDTTDETEDIQANRFGSFAPIRGEIEENTRAKWYVDGEDYMSAVADAILAAEHEILITDWQMNPFIFLKRPENGVTSLKWRLDKLLLKKAEERNFRIIILLYSPPAKRFLDLGNELVKDILSHPNIEVLYHPSLYTTIEHPFELPLRWSHHEKVIVIDRSVAFVGGIDLAYGRWDTHSHSLFDNYPHHPCVLEQSGECNAESALNEDNSSKRYCRWAGKDYGNTFLGGGRSDFDKPLEDYTDRSNDPRMPWHDVACSFDGPAALDITKHFIQRYKAITKGKSRNEIADNGDVTPDWAGRSARITAAHTTSNPHQINVKIQVLRSVDEWSANLEHEDSVYKAYIHAIENAEHSIYIENQFFISSQPKLKNKIQNALAERIIRAYKKSEDFHVMIVLPLQPEFPGEWGTDSEGDLASISYWNNATLYIRENSLFHKLKKGNIPEESIPRYFNVYSLRTHEVWPSDTRTGFKSEIIYVHSKLMIVDDRKSIIGSANINDRSMLGSRDSEVAVIIEDKEMVDGTMNGLPYRVGKFSHDLRCHLVKEHLGLLEKETFHSDAHIDVKDPVAKDFYTQLFEIAASNTEIYECVFPRRPAKLIRPSNEIRSRAALENWKGFDGLSIEEAREKLKKIRGRLVVYSAFFLEKDLDLSFVYKLPVTGPIIQTGRLPGLPPMPSPGLPPAPMPSPGLPPRPSPSPGISPRPAPSPGLSPRPAPFPGQSPSLGLSPGLSMGTMDDDELPFL